MKETDTDLLAKQLLAGKDFTHEFDIDYEDTEGKKFKGTFVVHRPTIGEKIKIGVIDARLKQETIVDIYTQNLTYMLSTLMIVIDEAPKWFIPGQIYDYDLLAVIFSEYVAWVNKFFRTDGGGASKTEKQPSNGTNVESDVTDGSGGN